MLVVLQEGSKAVRCWFSWRWKAARVCGGTVGGAAVVNYITAGGAVEVNCSAAGRQQNIGKLRAEQQRLNQNQLQAWQRSVQAVVRYQRR